MGSMNAGDDLSATELISQGLELEQKGKVASAIRLIQRAVEQARTQGDPESEATAQMKLAFLHFRMGHYSKATDLTQAALALAGPESEQRADALLQLGMIAAESSDLNAAENYLRQALDLCRQINCVRLLVRTLHNFSAAIYMPRGQISLSLAADREAYQVAVEHGLHDIVWGPLLTMCWDYWLMGQRQAVEEGLKSLQTVVQPGSVGDGYWYILSAHLSREAGDYPQAEALFHKAQADADISGLAEVGFQARLGLSRLHREMGDAPTAVAWAADSLRIADRTDYSHFKGLALIEHGLAVWGVGDYPVAEADFKAAQAVLAPQQLNYDLARASLYLAALLYRQKSPRTLEAWREAAVLISRGGFGFLVEQERSLAFPLLSAYMTNRDPVILKASAGLLEALQRTTPPPLKVVTLGNYRVWVGSRRVDAAALRQRKAGALLALLLLAPSGHCLQTDQVLEALWPDREPAAVQSLFHQATSFLRRALEPELPEKFPSRYLFVEEGRISLNLPSTSKIDFEIFLDKCKAKEWEEAIGMYQGDFLPDFLYAGWASATRQWLAVSYQQALLAWAEDQFKQGAFSAALEACRKILSLEPWHEQAALLAMKACVALGDRPGARRIYLQIKDILRKELDVSPQKDISDYFRSI